jgi:predicted permease
LTRSGFLSTQALEDVNRLTYWVGLPCALFYRIAGASPDVAAVGGLLLVGVLATLLAIAAAAVTARLIGLPGRSSGTFIQGVFRGNLAFIGLPVVLYAFSSAGAASANAENSALLAFGPMVVMYNILAVVVLLLAGGVAKRGMIRSVGYGLLTNPILIACLGGLVFSLANLHLPELLQRTLAAIGQMALPLALLCIGGTLHVTRLRGSLGPAFVGSLMKVAFVPGAGLLLGWWLGLSAEHLRIVLVLLACPTASVSYVLVRQLQGDEALASSMIVISNVLAVPAMAVALAVTA